MNKLLFLLIGLSALLACSSPKSAQPAEEKGGTKAPRVQTEEEKIVGSWEWDHTVCCSRRPKTISDTSDVATWVKFNAQGSAERYHGKRLLSVVPYEVSHGMMEDDRLTIKLQDVPRKALLSFRGDTMVIDYGYIDLQTEYYIRKSD